MEQTDLLRLLVETLERLRIRYAIVGSFASGVWGESRFTQDIDVVVDLKPRDVQPLCRAFSGPEFYVSEEAAREAVVRRGQFNVINPASANKIDFMISDTTPWAISQLKRRRRLPLFPDRDASFAAPEDVILSKLIYYRVGGSDKHLRDIRGILRVTGDAVDRAYIARFALELNVADIWHGNFISGVSDSQSQGPGA